MGAERPVVFKAVVCGQEGQESVLFGHAVFSKGDRPTKQRISYFLDFMDFRKLFFPSPQMES